MRGGWSSPDLEPRGSPSSASEEQARERGWDVVRPRSAMMPAHERRGQVGTSAAEAAADWIGLRPKAADGKAGSRKGHEEEPRWTRRKTEPQVSVQKADANLGHRG